MFEQLTGKRERGNKKVLEKEQINISKNKVCLWKPNLGGRRGRRQNKISSLGAIKLRQRIRKNKKMLRLISTSSK